MRALLVRFPAWRSAVTFAAAAAFLAPACSSDPSVLLPPGANAKRNRSVMIDGSACYLAAKGIDGPVACADETLPAGGLTGTGMRGVNGAPTPVFIGDYAANFVDNFKQIQAGNMRIPNGYGCAYSLQGIWKTAAEGNNGNTDDINNYTLTGFESILKAVRDVDGHPLWTAAYDLAEGGTCTYAGGQEVGRPILGAAAASKWAKIVRKVMKHYDRELPFAQGQAGACKGSGPLSWDCNPSIFSVEFGRDPFGAGGYTQATKGDWLAAYQAFAMELRGNAASPGEFTLPGNDVRLVGPSVVMSADPTNLSADGAVRSPIYDFIDFVVANSLPLTDLSIKSRRARRCRRARSSRLSRLTRPRRV